MSFVCATGEHTQGDSNLWVCSFNLLQWLRGMKTRYRLVEMYIGIHEGGEGGRWWTQFVKIPADTPEKKIARVAKRRTLKLLEGEKVTVAFVGVYHIPDPIESMDWHLTITFPNGDRKYKCCSDLDVVIDCAEEEFGVTEEQREVLWNGGEVVLADGTKLAAEQED
jgi:hypothetical protein